MKKLYRNRVTGGRKRQVDTVKDWFPSHAQGDVERVIREMIREGELLEAYGGGARDNVRLYSLTEAEEWLEDHGEDTTWL